MKKVWIYFLFPIIQLSIQAQSKTPEDYYVSAFNEMSDMLAERDNLSIKRAVFLAEWASYEGNLDYKTDFCDEIERIKGFIRSIYEVNNLEKYKTGMQMAISSYIASPLSGNNMTDGGAGATVQTDSGSHSVIVTDGFHPNGRAVTSGHEILGHGRSWAAGYKENSQHVETIRTENLILRVMGISFINTGINHGPKTLVPQPSLLPAFR